MLVRPNTLWQHLSYIAKQNKQPTTTSLHFNLPGHSMNNFRVQGLWLARLKKTGNVVTGKSREDLETRGKEKEEKKKRKEGGKRTERVKRRLNT